MTHVLLVDDDTSIVSNLRTFLNQEGFQVTSANNQKETIDLLDSGQYHFDLALLDVSLPDGSGFELFEKLKQMGDFPVLFLTACGEDEDKFRGLGLGADDYMVKPFLPRELILRIGAILRRSYKNEEPQVKLADSIVDFSRAEVRRGSQTIPLTAKEFALLSALYRNAGRIVTIDALCEAAWGDNPFGYENSLMAHIRRIREKIEAEPSHPKSLLTVKGLGYKLLVEGR